MRKIIIVLVVIVATLFILSIAKDFIIKVAAERGMEIATGVPLRIKSLHLSLTRQLIDIKDIIVYNPRGFSDKIMANAPLIYVNCDVPSLFKGKMHFEDLRINVKEFMVVKNEKGELNLDALAPVKTQQEAKKPAPKKEKKPVRMQIDNLELAIGKVIYKDYSQGGKPVVREFIVNINERYKNIQDPAKIVSLIIVRALAKTTIAQLANFDIAGLQSTVQDTLRTAQQIVGQAGAMATETTKKAAETTKEAVGTTTKKLEKTTDALKSVLTNPFGSKEEVK